MNTFPAISRHPSIQGYGETRSGDSVIMGSTESGYPTINKLFTFDPNIWSFTLEGVSQADKESVEAFYEANKDVPFYWVCEQESAGGDVTYEVAFTKQPSYQLQGRKVNAYLWQIGIELIQTAS